MLKVAIFRSVHWSSSGESTLIPHFRLMKIENLCHLQRSIFVCQHPHARNIQQYLTNKSESIPSIEGNKNWLNYPRTIPPFFFFYYHTLVKIWLKPLIFEFYNLQIKFDLSFITKEIFIKPNEILTFFFRWRCKFMSEHSKLQGEAYF